MSQDQFPPLASRPRPIVLVAVWLLTFTFRETLPHASIASWCTGFCICGERVLGVFHYLLWNQRCLKQCALESHASGSRDLIVVVCAMLTSLSWNYVSPNPLLLWLWGWVDQEELEWQLESRSEAMVMTLWKLYSQTWWQKYAKVAYKIKLVLVLLCSTSSSSLLLTLLTHIHV